MFQMLMIMDNRQYHSVFNPIDEGSNLDCLLGPLSDPFQVVHVTKLNLLNTLHQEVCISALPYKQTFVRIKEDPLII